MSKWEEAKFKRVPEGWTFDANPAVVGPARLYLVSDAQRNALIRRIRHARWISLLAILIVMLGILMGYAKLVAGEPYLREISDAGSPITALMLGVSILAFLGLTLACAIGSSYLATWPVLAGAPRIGGWISLADRFRRQAEGVSAKTLIGLVVCWLVACAGLIYQALVLGDGVVPSLVMAACAALLAIHQFALLVVKLRAKSSQPD